MRGTATPLTRGPFSITLPDTAGPLTIPADGSGGGLSDSLMDWLVNVDVFMTAIAQTNWNTLAVSGTRIYTAHINSDGTQNDSLSFDVVLAAGTWTFELIHHTASNRGVYSVQLAGVEKGTIDGYDAAGFSNVRSQVTDIAVTQSAKYRLSLVMATKNASSSAYYGVISHLQFKRTA